MPRSPLGVLQRRASNFIAPKYGSVRAGVLTLTFSAVGSGILGLPCAGAPRVDALLHVSLLYTIIWSVKRPYIAEAPWSEAEWAVALRFVELLQAQLGRQVPYYY